MKPTRRRMIGILAASALTTAFAARTSPVVTWRGRALGAEASIKLAHADEKRARSAMHDCQIEISRLERVFSLYQRQSALTRLNRDGELSPAPPELIEVLLIARQLSVISDGVFDVTVQPLWQALSRSRDCHDGIKAALDLVNWRKVDIFGDTVRLGGNGMAITLNGIAQGYITDRIVDRLRGHGFDHALVHMGEHRGIGKRADEKPWRLAIADPDGSSLVDDVPLENQALATSSPLGTPLSCAEEIDHHHLIDPRTGRPARHWRRVSVIAERAVIADGLSTAIAVSEPKLADQLLQRGGGQRAILFADNGRRIDLQSTRED